MAKPGRKPKPTFLRLLEGNPGKRALNEFEPVVDRPAEKPVTVVVDPVASAEWDRLIATMPPGMYTAADQAIVTQYALAWAMLAAAQREIDAHGFMIERDIISRKTGEIIRTDYVPNPALKLWKTAQDLLVRITERLGLTPGARSQLKIPGKADTSPSKFAGLIAGRWPAN